MNRLKRFRGAALTLAVITPALIAFPRHTITTLAIASALLSAGLRRPTIAVLCALLVAGAIGWRTDTSHRPQGPPLEHQQQQRDPAGS